MQTEGGGCKNDKMKDDKNVRNKTMEMEKKLK